MPEPRKEEVNDWLHGLLAIGTFGKNDIIEDLERTNFHGDMSSSLEDQPHGSIFDELRHLHDDLRSLLHKQGDHASASASASELTQEPPSQIQYPSENARCSNEPSAKTRPSLLQTGMVPSRAKDSFVDNKKNGIIGKKSLSFLLKKILVCRSGFGLPPSTPKASIPESRTEMVT